MNKLLLILVLAALSLFPVGAIANPVSPEMARKAAVTFLQAMGCKDADSFVDRSDGLPTQHLYLFASDGGGFVLLSANDATAPVLGYSTTNRFDVKNLPAPVAEWLADYDEQIAFYAGLDPSNGLGTKQWALLLNGLMTEAVRDSSVGPLMSTTWNQSPYYNYYCPDNSLAGCAAIAAAQVMKYWAFPTTGYGSRSYYCEDYGSLSANFGNTTYNWSQMPDVLNSSSTQAQIDAVATLVYHVGVSVEMDYSPDGSSASSKNSGNINNASAENALREYFKYKSTLHSVDRADFSPVEFLDILYAELDAARPFIYRGTDEGGHAFVFDGYDTLGLFHVNWGWGGSCDGYYAVGALNPSNGGNPYHFYNKSNAAIIGIEPNFDFDTSAVTTVSARSSNPAWGTTTGSGSYLFGDTVYVRAAANEGCRFLQWSDGCKYNPRPFIATGGVHDFTAIFQHLEGDTLSYCSTFSRVTSLGFSSPQPVQWGIRLPVSTLTHGHHLRQVQVYVNAVGNYTAIIYLDDPSNAVYSQPFVVTDSMKGSWITVALDSLVPVDACHDLWIAFRTDNITYPATMTHYGGNPDGKLWGVSLEPDRRERSFMIRGIFAANPNDYAIYASPNDSSMGSVLGGGSYAPGETVTLTATPATDHRFVGWSDGLLDNPRVFTASQDLSLVANFAPDSVGMAVARPLDVALFPNPTRGNLHIDACEVLSVVVFDRVGRQVAEFRNTCEVDLTTLASGLYTLRILVPNGSHVAKVVKE